MMMMSSVQPISKNCQNLVFITALSGGKAGVRLRYQPKSFTFPGFELKAENLILEL